MSAERMISEEELLPLLQERLALGQSVRYLPFRGVSMMPLLRQGKDSVEISPLPERLRKYDLPVYRYPSGKIVMHRVVDVKDEHYICLGDNTYEYEKISHNQMIGLVSAIKRGDRRISVDNRWYRLYCRAWVGLFPLRRWVKYTGRKVKRLLRRSK